MTKHFIADVVQEFQCKLSGQYFRVGTQYVSDEVRVRFLTEEGYVEGATEVAPSVPDGGSNEQTDDFPKHVGGGYYELPNGEKIKGKEAAEEAMTNLSQE